MPPSVTGWTRLEPYARSQGLQGGLRAEVHDPLWLLARQWQFGEFRGEDAGSPVLARLRLDRTPLTRYQPSGVAPGGSVAGQRLWSPPPGGATPDRFSWYRGVPLETLVERERVHLDGVPRPRLAAEAGLHLARLLGPAGATLTAALLARYPLAPPPADSQRPLDGDTRRFLDVTAGRVVDGALVYAVMRAARDATTADRLPTTFRSPVLAAVSGWQAWLGTLAAADRARLDAALAPWQTWYEGLFSEPEAAAPGGPAGGPSWVADRLEYRVAVAAPMPDGEVVLAATEYTGGRLDWYDFDALPAASLGAVRADLIADDDPRNVAPEAVRRSAIPVPVTFRGMPAARFWEFEDARVDFGAVAAGPQDLARLLLIEFALVYGSDWFVLPVDVPVGSLCRTRWLVVSDTFGERTLVRSARDVERTALPAGQTALPFDLFGLAPDRRAAAGPLPPDLLFLPPALAAGLERAAIEEVLLLRDEMANLAWAVERVVEGLAGRALNRSEAYLRARQQQAQAQATNTPPSGGAAAPDGPPVYWLATEVPDHWLPLFPTRPQAANPAIRLLRGGVPWGRIVQSNGVPLLLYEEEVPRTGARVGRAYQYARWFDGRSYLWIGRRKGAGRGEGASGLRFDVLEPPR